MTTKQLADAEDNLYSIIKEIHEKMQAPEKLEYIFDEYRKVHQGYAELADKDNEALKRGLFIQWYAWTEPSYLSGISELDPKSEQKIIEQIEDSLSRGSIDEELKWMLNYYASWDFVLKDLKISGSFPNLSTTKQKFISPQALIEMP